MRKILVALSLIAMTTTAMAQPRHERHREAPRQQHRYQEHHRGGFNPWVAGALGLGVLGAGAYYYNQRQCWNEAVVDMYGRQIYDRYGRPLAQTVCQ